MSNLTAFLSVIAACEGTGDRYDILYGGGTFTGDQHPNKAVTAGGYTSTAAGRYQILFSTWSGFRAAVHPAEPKFDPSGQDWCAQWLIDRRGALADVNAGRLEDAIAKCGKEWASLPGSPYGQPVRTLQFCLDAYTKAGGTLATPASIEDAVPDAGTTALNTSTQPEATVADTPSTAPSFTSILQGAASVVSVFNPLIGGLANALITAFAPLAQEKIAGALNKHTDNPAVGQQVATNLVNTAIQLTGKTDPVEATVAAKADAAIMEQLQANALAFIDKISPILDKVAQWDKDTWAAEQAGKDAAAARARTEPWDMTPAVVKSSEGLTWAIVVGGLLATIGGAYIGGKDLAMSIFTPMVAILMAVVKNRGEVFAYRFDGTKQSEATAIAKQTVQK